MVDCDQRGRGAAAMTNFLNSEYIKSKQRQQTDTFWKVKRVCLEDVKSVNGMGTFSQVCSLTDKASFGIKMAEGA